MINRRGRRCQCDRIPTRKCDAKIWLFGQRIQCQVMLCEACVTEIDGKDYCKTHADEARMPERKSWPYETPEELTAAGYEFSNASRCRGPNCGAMIEWWTTPNGKKMPLDPDTMGPHWSSCPDSKQF